MRFDIAIGDMRQTGTFKKNTPVPNDTGGFVDSFSDLVTCRGRLRKQKGSKALEDGDTVFNKNYEWICRVQNAIVIDTDTALEISGQLYRILDFEKIDEIRHWYRFVISIFQIPNGAAALTTEQGDFITTEDGQNMTI